MHSYFTMPAFPANRLKKREAGKFMLACAQRVWYNPLSTKF